MLEALHKAANDDLLRQLSQLRVEERRCVSALVAHLAEVDARRLYAELGFTSMFRYLTDGLGYAEDAAYKRVTVARLARRCGSVLDRLKDGRMHLSGAALVGAHLKRFKREDGEALLEAVPGLSKRAIERLLAERAPRPDVPSTVRALPRRDVAKANASPGLFDAEAPDNHLARAR